MSLPRDIRVYEWPDGTFVELLDMWFQIDPLRIQSEIFGGMFQIKSPLSVSLFTMDVRRVGERPLVFAFKPGENLQPIIHPTYLPKLLGFLLDLGVSYPTDTPQRSLIPRGDQRTDYAPYPRFVSDIRWEDRYSEAQRFVLKSKLETWKPEANIRTEKYLGLLRNFEILPPEFYLDNAWHATYSSMAVDNIESLYFHALVDKVLDEELILPESSRTAWEAANVERGSFLIPSPEEVELFRLLDERLPLLLPVKQLEEWLQGRT